MAKTEITVRASTSNAIQFQLLAGTAPIDLTAVGTVQLWLRDQAGGTSMQTNLGGGQLSINGAAGGSVSWTPGTATLASGSAPYRGYFKIFVTPSSWYFCPEDSEVSIDCREVW